jgi:hypothetical protein
MVGRRRWSGALPLAAALPLAWAAPAWAQQQQQPAADKVAVELNRLAPGAGGANACQVTMVVRNGTGREFRSLQTDLVTFGPDGVVNGRLLVELGPLPAGKTSLRAFDFPEVACEGIDRVLLNEVPACEDAAGGAVEGGCTALVEPASRAKAAFFK